MLGTSKGRARKLFRLARHALLIGVVLLVAACSGGGCSSGCSGCGMTPLTRPIPSADIISNAGALRVTRSGLDFIQTAMPTLAQSLVSGSSGGELQYPLTLGTQTVDGIQLAFCPNGASTTSSPEQCELDVELGQATFAVNAVTPDAITVSGTLPVQMQDLPITGTYTVPYIYYPFSLTLNAGLGSESPGTCGGTGGLPNEGYVTVPFTITLPIITDTIAPRIGYAKIDPASVTVSVGITSSMVEVCANCDITYFGINLDSFCDGLTNDLVSLAFSALQSTLESEIQTTVQSQLCTKPDTTGACPVGSALDTTSGNCDYQAQPGTCLPLELGTDGLLNLGSLLQSISYGTTSTLDFSLAGGGTMIPANAPTAPTGSPPDSSGNTPNGVTLGMVGAMIPDPISACVPQASNPVPTGIPIPVELEQNTETPWPSTDPTGPDVGLALSAAYMNYALASIYNSGALCLGITSDSYPQLNSAALSLFAPSIEYLTFEQQAAAMAVTTRPQLPPSVTVGDGTDPNTDPLLMLALDQFAIDFYVWSDDRYVRAFTYAVDLSIPINLSTAVTATNPNGEIVPTLGTVTAANGAVSNSELLLEDPATIAGGLTPLIGAIFGQVAGSIPPISLASLTSSLGVSLTIPDGGIRKLSSGTYDFIALFGDLSMAPTPSVKVKPQATLVGQVVHPEAMALATYDPAKLPELHLSFGAEAPAGAPVEYTYWIDQGTRSPWSTATDVTIQNQTLFMQGKHTLYVSARQVGLPASEAEVPAAVPFLIDVIPPTMTLTTTDSGATLTAWDYVSDQAHLSARTRVTDRSGVPQAWSDWEPLSALATLPAAGGSIAAEVRDEAGNVASSETALIRGQNDLPASVAGACNCSTPGTRTTPGTGGPLLLLGAAFGLMALGRRGRGPRAATAAALGAGVVVGALSQGCSCGGSSTVLYDAGLPDTSKPGHDAAAHHDSGKDVVTHPKDSGHDTGVDSSVTGCGSNCNQPCLPALTPGKIGAYTSIAKDGAGTVWVAGYDDSSVVDNLVTPYGDLVVGKYDTTKLAVDWATVDGLPGAGDAGAGCPLNDPTGWRGGQAAPGPDVGLWTSIQLDANDHPIVSYYDATNAALKFASSSDGVTWTAYTVMQAASSDIGRYGKMLVVNGVPVIAFLVMEPGDGGKVRSKVELATGKVATPASASDWTFEDAAVDDDGPCTPSLCPSPSVCIKETWTCSAPATGCTGGDAGGCASGEVCVGGGDAGPSCGTQVTSSSYYPTYPGALGDYITMAPTVGTSNGVGIVAYDRNHGALVQIAKWSGTWQQTVLDSETGARAPGAPDGGIAPAETGDVGIGASLFISSAGDWYVSYVNGTTEALQFILVPGGNQQPAAPEVIDNGTSLGGVPYPDGQHIVGDDSFLEVDPSGVVTVSYQDATAGTLHVATGTPLSGGTHAWNVVSPSQPNEFAGAFSHAILGDTTSFANYWVSVDSTTQNETGNVSFVAP